MARSRRALRRARVQAALGIPRSTVESHRDRLLLTLLEGPGQHQGTFDSLPENTVDVVVSLATADIEEGSTDALSVMMMCIETLALDGQFARLATLAPRLSGVGSRLQVERPYLWAAIEGMAHLMRGSQAAALAAASAVLTPSDERSAQTRTDEAISDLIVLAALRAVADSLSVEEDRTPTVDYVGRCRQEVIERADGLALSFVDALDAIGLSSWIASPKRVLQASDPTFSSDAMEAYLAGRGVPTLFPAQIGAIQSGATTASDCVVALPTSSGKTFLAELRIAASLVRNPGSSAIYVAPYRLLGRQVLDSFSTGLERLGLTVQDLGSGFDGSLGVLDGDSGPPDVAIATPERLDSLIRAASVDNPVGRQAAALLDRCRILVFDELQLVGRPGRGPRFEMLLTRLRDRYPSWEFLGLSAASHGADDLSQWLIGQDPLSGSRRPTGTLEVLWETSGRMIQRVGTIRAAVGELPRTRPVDDAVSLILRFERSHQPVLAVETSRVAAESLAKKVSGSAPEAGAAWREQLTDAELIRVDEVVEEVKAVLGDAHPLAEHISYGVAFHHAGVPTHILRLIEGLARERLLRLLSATTTVAEGADLPFRVVVIPHLNFPGTSGRLERDLYLNVIGRAGRANVTVEGMVFVLDSDARTLSSVVRGSLWSDTQRDRVQSQLAEPILNLDRFARLGYYFDVEGHVLGWLGEGRSYVEEQAAVLASKTFAWFQGNQADRDRVSGLIEDILADLEESQFVVAGSPYQLTEMGSRARLSGLSSTSVQRLSSFLDDEQLGRMTELGGEGLLSETDCEWLALLLFQAVETVEHSLWLRRSDRLEEARFRTFLGIVEDGLWPNAGQLSTDIQLLSQWIHGAKLEDLAVSPPRADHARSLFGGKDLSKLTSDAAEYVGKLSYPSGWVWSGARVLAGDVGEQMPAFIKDALEFGVPSESAAHLVRRVGLTRSGALQLMAISPRWEPVESWIAQAEVSQLREQGLTTLDTRRLVALHRSLVRRG